MEEKISEKVIEEIKEKNVSLKPKWQFLIRDYIVWVLGFISLIIGSISFATILYMLRNNDWDIYSHISDNLFGFIILTLPYFWLIFLGVFILSAYYNFRHTKKGYKFPLSKIIFFSIFANIFVGSFFYNMGIGQAIDNMVERELPFYSKLINQRKGIWEHHDEGLLAGIVMEVSGNTAVIRDVEGDFWYVSDFSTSTPQIFRIKQGDMIRILGVKIDEENFQAEQVLPMRGMRWIEDHGPQHFPQGPGMMFERKMEYMRINE